MALDSGCIGVEETANVLPARLENIKVFVMMYYFDIFVIVVYDDVGFKEFVSGIWFENEAFVSQRYVMFV